MLKRIAKFFIPYWVQVLIALGCTLVVGGAAGATAYLVKPMLDKVFIEGDQTMLWLVPIGLVSLYGVKGFCRYLQGVLMTQTGEQVIFEIRSQLMRNIQYRDMSFFDRNPTGVLMAKLLNDVATMQRAIPSLIMLVRQSINALGLLIVLFQNNWLLASVAMLMFPPAALFIGKITKKIKNYARAQMVTGGLIHSVVVESFSGIEVVKTFGSEESVISRFNETGRQLLNLIIRIAKLNNFTPPFLEFIGAGAASVIIWYGGSEVIKGATTPGEFFSFMTAMFMIYDPIKRLGSLNNDIALAMVSAERVFEVMDMPESDSETLGDEELTGSIEEVSFNNVVFSYHDDRERVLKGVDFLSRKGMVTALVGESGSGKSTILKLLPRLYSPDTGNITINGKDINDFTVKSLRSRMAIVTQNTYLFDDTIMNNMLLGRPEATEEEVIAAAKAANAHNFILSMPKGYQTPVGERGNLLSGGQKQRVAIARAILRDAPILILDEATSSLDSESEREIQDALEKLMKGRTTFVIAHRLSTVRHADQILFIREGVVAERGRHDELYAEGGGYANLCNIQFGERPPEETDTPELPPPEPAPAAG